MCSYIYRNYEEGKRNVAYLKILFVDQPVNMIVSISFLSSKNDNGNEYMHFIVMLC